MMMVFVQGSFLLEVWGHFMSEARVPVDERQPESPAHSLPHSPRDAQRAVPSAEVAGPSRSMHSLVALARRDRAL